MWLWDSIWFSQLDLLCSLSSVAFNELHVTLSQWPLRSLVATIGWTFHTLHACCTGLLENKGVNLSYQRVNPLFEQGGSIGAVWRPEQWKQCTRLSTGSSLMTLGPLSFLTFGVGKWNDYWLWLSKTTTYHSWPFVSLCFILLAVTGKSIKSYLCVERRSISYELLSLINVLALKGAYIAWELNLHAFSWI